MKEFEQFLNDLGRLHDARVTKLALDVAERSFTIEVDDIYSATDGLPGYKGPKPSRIKLKEVSQVKIAFDGSDEFNIYNFSVVQINENQWAASITLWPEGKTTMNFQDVEFPQEQEP